MTLAWDAEHGNWTQTDDDDGPDAGLPADQRTVREEIRAEGRPLTIDEVRDRLDQPDEAKAYDAAAQLLSRMHRAGLLAKAGRGKYTLPELVNSSTCQLDGDGDRPVDILTN